MCRSQNLEEKKSESYPNLNLRATHLRWKAPLVVKDPPMRVEVQVAIPENRVEGSGQFLKAGQVLSAK